MYFGDVIVVIQWFYFLSRVTEVALAQSSCKTPRRKVTKQEYPTDPLAKISALQAELELAGNF